MTDKRTIEVEKAWGGGTKPITKEDFVLQWGNHAAELSSIGMTVYTEAKDAAGKRFETLYAAANPKEQADVQG